jgi:hypothetical protein
MARIISSTTPLGGRFRELRNTRPITTRSSRVLRFTSGCRQGVHTTPVATESREWTEGPNNQIEAVTRYSVDRERIVGAHSAA